MVICIPTDSKDGLEAPVCGHFGQAPMYALVDSETNEINVIPNESSHRGGTDLPPVWLNKQGVNIMLCSGMGQRAVMLFKQSEIPVYFGEEATVGGMLEAYRNGSLHLATEDDGCVH